ncbi:MAG TPA: DUF3160 domain-containing protein, partial [Bacteroidota bacterium]|nr:DUF3160 domain-containing protein [Bacteroidota bacterium]
MITALLFVPCFVYSQSVPSFDLAVYKQFLETHQNMSTEELQAFRPAGTFTKSAPTNFGSALFSDSIQLKYKLTGDERSLIESNGFMVSERLRRPSFGAAFGEIFHNDLPVFISTDAILHALHMSYDAMLRTTEERFLISKLDTLLTRLHAQVPVLASRYAAVPAMRQSLLDADLYLTVARKLLDPAVLPKLAESAGAVDTVMVMIASEQPANYPLFSSTMRVVDFSQFTVRGHYTQSENLKRYFRSMMWLGRTEMYLIAPVNAIPEQSKKDIQRQTIDAALIAEAATGAD